MSTSEQQQPGPIDLHIFESLPGNFLLLSPDLHVLAMSEGYLRLTGKTRQALTGKYLFAVFPERDHNGNVAVSLKKVQETGQADELPVSSFGYPS